jgi:hypothetical protein
MGCDSMPDDDDGALLVAVDSTLLKKLVAPLLSLVRFFCKSSLFFTEVAMFSTMFLPMLLHCA